MATNEFFNPIDMMGLEITNMSVEKLASDPTGAGLYAGRIWENTTSGRIKWYDGSTVFELAHKTDLETFGALVGTHDATAGLPTVGSGDAGAIRQGDYWIITTPGTIVGIGGSDVLEAGDFLFASTDGAALAAAFYGVQTNLDLPSNMLQGEVVALASLPASTLTAIPTTFTNVYSVQVFNSAGNDITAGLCVNNSNQLESAIALTNLTIRVVGN